MHFRRRPSGAVNSEAPSRRMSFVTRCAQYAKTSTALRSPSAHSIINALSHTCSSDCANSDGLSRCRGWGNSADLTASQGTDPVSLSERSQPPQAHSRSGPKIQGPSLAQTRPGDASLNPGAGQNRACPDRRAARFVAAHENRRGRAPRFALSRQPGSEARARNEPGHQERRDEDGFPHHLCVSDLGRAGRR